VGFLFGVASRMLLGMLVCLTLIVLLNRRMRWHRSARLTYLVAGIGLWGAMTSVYWSAQFIPSGLISVLFGLNPVVTGLMATIWLGERVLTPFRITGLGLGLAGLSVVFAHGLETDADAALGIAGVLLSVHIHAATAVWVKRIGAGIPALETTTGTLLVAVPLFLMSWGMLDGRLPPGLEPRTTWAIAYLAVVGSVLGFVLYFYVLRCVEANRVALITLVTPVIALFLGQEINGEDIGRRTLMETAIILAGLACYHWGDHWFGRRA